ncbi:hypothetical protein Q3G72_003162 [Acer saccharum]|nr:hypothetical protein Q3G72_003162 [Acer saccharum]
MEYNDLSKLCESLSLAGDTDIPEIIIKAEVKRTSDRKVAHSLVGHPLRECPLRQPSEEEGRPLKYGAWIRAGMMIGEETKGKWPRGDGDHHSGGSKQNVSEPKTTSRWKPKNVLPPPLMVEMNETPVVDSSEALRLTAKQKGKEKISAIMGHEAFESGILMPNDFGKSRIVGNPVDNFILSLEIQNQINQEVNFVNTANDKGLIEIVLEDV